MISTLILVFVCLLTGSTAQAKNFDYLYWSNQKIVPEAATQKRPSSFLYQGFLYLAYFEFDRSRTSSEQPLVIEKITTTDFTPHSKVKFPSFDGGHCLNFYTLNGDLFISFSRGNKNFTLKRAPDSNQWQASTGLKLPEGMLRYRIYQAGDTHLLLFTKKRKDSEHYLYTYRNGTNTTKRHLSEIKTSLVPSLWIHSTEHLQLYFIDDKDHHWLKTLKVSDNIPMQPSVLQEFDAKKQLVRASPEILTTSMGRTIAMQNLVNGEMLFYTDPKNSDGRGEKALSLPKQSGNLHMSFIPIEDNKKTWVLTEVIPDGRIRLSSHSPDNTIKQGLFFSWLKKLCCELKEHHK